MSTEATCTTRKPSNTLQITWKQTADGILREYEPADIRLMFEEETKMEDDPSHAGKTFVDLFREAVAKYPDRPAVRERNGRAYL